MPTLSRNASWLINAGADDTARVLAEMTGTPEDIADLQAAIAEELASSSPRASRLKPMQAKLRKFANSIEAPALEVEVLGKPVHRLPTESLHNQYHRAAQTAAAQATAYAVLCGLELERIRKALKKPGARTDLATSRHACPEVATGWESWVQSNCDFSSKTAERYIKLAENVTHQLGDHTFTGLLEVAPSKLPEAKRAELLDAVSHATKGETLRQLYLDFGIIKPGAPNPRKGTTAPLQPEPPKKSQKQARLEDAREAFFVWTESFEKLLRAGHLEHLDQQGLLELKEFIAGVRDRLNARLKSR